MKTQEIKRSDLKAIYPKVCEGWQKIIMELVFLQDEGKNIQVDEELIKKAYSEADSDQRKLIEKYFTIISGKIQDRINTWQKVLDSSGLLETEIVPYKGSNLTREQKSINAQAKWFKIAEIWNEGWTPNWKNTNEYKYRPYKSFSGGSVGVHVDVAWSTGVLDAPSGLHFKSKELSEAFVKNFSDIIDDYYMI
jgi:hypothetical protein